MIASAVTVIARDARDARGRARAEPDARAGERDRDRDRPAREPDAPAGRARRHRRAGVLAGPAGRSREGRRRLAAARRARPPAAGPVARVGRRSCLGACACGHLGLQAARGLVPAVQERDGRHARVRGAEGPASRAGALAPTTVADRAQRRAGDRRRRRSRAGAHPRRAPASPRSPTSRPAPPTGAQPRSRSRSTDDPFGNPAVQRIADMRASLESARPGLRVLLAEGTARAGRLPGGSHPRHQGDRADRARGRAADADRPAARARRAALPARDGDPVLPRHARDLAARLPLRLRAGRGRPRVRADRLHLPRRARRRLQHLPDEPRPRGGPAARDGARGCCARSSRPGR